jgi:hypothetical protein
MTTAIREGYKLVNADGTTFRGSPRPRFRVGTTHRLPAGVEPVCCQVGFHYCPRALDCVRYVPHDVSYDRVRLLRVVVPNDAAVATDDDDECKYAASALTAVDDVTADMDWLLTGVVESSDPISDDWISYRRGKVAPSTSSSNLLRIIHGHDGTRVKEWTNRRLQRYPCGTIVDVRGGIENAVPPGGDGWADLNAELDRTDFV